MKNRRKIATAANTSLIVPALVLAVGAPVTGDIAAAHASTPTLPKVKSVKVSNVCCWVVWYYGSMMLQYHVGMI